MDGRLDFKQKRAIEGFIGTGPKKFSLLYSFTRDGAAAETFHEKCDNKGPTATVVYDTSGSIYGGYIEESWTTADEDYIEDDKAFLFRLMFGGKIALKKFPVITSEKAFYCDETAGPVFGSGHDLKVFDGTLTQRNRQYTLNGSTSFGSTYDMGGITTEQITNNVKTVHDVEVFSVTGLLNILITFTY